MRQLVTFSTVWLMSTVTCLASDWLQFRGTDGTASATGTAPAQWSADSNLAWKNKLPGPGASSPIVVGDRIFLTCYSGYGVMANNPGNRDALVRHLVCVNRTSGKTIWTKDVSTKSPEASYSSFQTQHGYASSTPASDGQRIYAFFGTPGIFAFDLEGKQLWHADVGTGTHGWGTGSSVVLEGEHVIVNGAIEAGEILAFKKENGDPAWKYKLSNRETWSTPAIVESDDGKRELVVSTKGRISGVDPKSGKEVWHCEGVGDYVCPSVVPGKGVAYVTGGRRSELIAVKTGGQGDVTSSHILWRAQVGANTPTPVLVDGHIHGVSNDGITYCVKADTGDIVYRERLTPDGPEARPAAFQPRREGGKKGRPGGGRGGGGGGGLQFYASAVAADGKVYFPSRTSGVFVVAADPAFKLLAVNRLEGDSSIFDSTPAIVDGHLYFRSNESLYCVGTK